LFQELVQRIFKRADMQQTPEPACFRADTEVNSIFLRRHKHDSQPFKRSPFIWTTHEFVYWLWSATWAFVRL